MRRFGKQICGRRVVPHGFVAPDGSRPHEIQHWDEADHNLYRASTVHFVGNDGALYIERDQEFFTHYEIGPGVDTGHPFGAVDDPPEYRLAIHLRRRTLRAKGYSERAQNLYGISPDLQTVFG